MIKCKVGRVTNKCGKDICCMYCDDKMNCNEQCLNSVELESDGIDALNGCLEAEEE